MSSAPYAAELDVYSERLLKDDGEDNGMSVTEQAFMLGYLAADRIDT